jgi:cell division inhibitor SepF
MATSFLKKTMVYLGLLDDEYDEYDEFDDRAPRGFSSVTRVDPQQVEMEPEPTSASRLGSIRAVSSRETVVVAPQQNAVNPTRPPATAVAQSASVRPISPESSRVQIVAPSRFGDAKDIADCLKGNRPVIVNLQVADRDLQRRMIDFCSGVTYALSGEMEKVADEVFLLAPTNVKVSDEERQRLQERGFGRG